KTRSRPVIAMPYTLEIGDIPLFLERGGNGEDFYDMIVDQLDQLVVEGAKRPRVMAMALHPFLIGHQFRARWLDKALGYIRKKKGTTSTKGRPTCIRRARCWRTTRSTSWRG